MAFEKTDAFFQRHATAIRIFVIALILLAILLRVGIAHVRENNRIQELREQGWYLIGTCGPDAFLLFDVENAAELEAKAQQYEADWQSRVRDELAYTENRPDLKPTVYLLIPDDEIRYGKTGTCDHGGYSVNLCCEVYREHALQQIEWITEK